jgi:hypothetical protein
MPEYEAQQGDSIISLSKQHGLPVEKIWDHPDNRALRERSRESAILFPGDRITIPERELREEEAVTEQRHHFRCQSRTTRLEVRFLRHDEPRAAEPYVLTVAGRTSGGNLDEDGWLRVRVPATAREAVVMVGEPGRQERYELGIGHLDPIDEVRGVQQRLNNLGFRCGPEDEELGPRTEAALRAFQNAHDLEATGRIDDATKDRLRELHGC